MKVNITILHEKDDGDQIKLKSFNNFEKDPFYEGMFVILDLKNNILKNKYHNKQVELINRISTICFKTQTEKIKYFIK